MLKKKVTKVILAVVLAVTLINTFSIVSDALGWDVISSDHTVLPWTDQYSVKNLNDHNVVQTKAGEFALEPEAGEFRLEIADGITFYGRFSG